MELISSAMFFDESKTWRSDKLIEYSWKKSFARFVGRTQ